MSEREKNSVAEMLGESLREIGILVVVFVPLEAYKGTAWNGWVLAGWVAGTLFLASSFIAGGILLERKRPIK